MRHQFQMLRIAAQSVVAQMIDLAIAGDVAEVVCVGDEMNSHSVAVQTHSSVAATTSITGGWPRPQVARRRLAPNQETHVDDVATGFNSLDDGEAAVFRRLGHQTLE